MQPSSSIASEAVQTEPREPAPLALRYAENDDDVIAIHRFLLVVARGAMLCPVNVQKSLLEVIRVTTEEVALMAMRGDMLVGTLGLIRPVWWYGDDAFLTDRWNFVVDAEKHGPAEEMLLDEARKIAAMSKLKFINQGKIRRGRKAGDYLMFPRVHLSEADIYSPPEGNC